MRYSMADPMSKRVAVVLVTTILVLLTAEFVLWMVHFPVNTMVDHPYYLYIHPPHTTIEERGEEYSYRFTTDEGGFYDTMHTREPTGKTRIMVIGDSMVEGAQVPFTQHFGKLLEEGLGKERAEVLIRGIGSWATENQLQYFELEGKYYQPDIVILFLHANDIIDNERYGIYEIADGELQDRTPLQFSRFSSLKRHTQQLRLINLLYRTYAFIKYKIDFTKAAEKQKSNMEISHHELVRYGIAREFFTKEWSLEMDRTVNATILLMKIFSENVESNNATFVAFLVPLKE